VWHEINMSFVPRERDLAVPMRDGVRLFANLFRPIGAFGPEPSAAE
jgi:predicted acyl esterase